MCFSATASFAASGYLAVVGIATLRQATKKQRLIASIPLLFAIQQALEGIQWLAIDAGRVCLTAGYGFIFFALLLWPIYIPLTVYLLDKKRRNITKWFLVLGIALASYFLGILFLGPMLIQPMALGIYYKIGMLFGVVTGSLYFVAICGALITSSIRAYRIFGIITFASVFITALFFRLTFASTWCFFAALLSSLIYLYIKEENKK